GDLPGLAFEGESALDADDGSASTARTHSRRNVADMPPLDAIASQGEDVSGEHVDPAQPAPGRRPYGPFAVKGDRIGELFRPHGLRQAHLARSDKASQTAATPRTSPTRARVSPSAPSAEPECCHPGGHDPAQGRVDVVEQLLARRLVSADHPVDDDLHPGADEHIAEDALI